MTVDRYTYPDELELDKDEAVISSGSALERIDSESKLNFDELYEQYGSMVFRLVFHILGNREEALDVSQEVFLTIYRKLHTFRGDSSIKTWIYRIAANRASNRFRWWNRLRRRGTISLEEHLSKIPDCDHSLDLKSNIQSPEEALLMKEEREEIERMLLQLPLQHRIGVILRDIDGLSYEEIAASMQVSVGTVKSRIARGREMLKHRLRTCL